MTDLLDLTGDPAGHVQQRIDTLTEWMDRAVTVGGTLGMTPAHVKHVEDTALIDEVAARYVGTDPDSEDLAKTYPDQQHPQHAAVNSPRSCPRVRHR
jgi:hypothetical protein